MKQLCGNRTFKGPVEIGEPCGNGTITHADGTEVTGLVDANGNILHGESFYDESADPGYKKGKLIFVSDGPRKGEYIMDAGMGDKDCSYAEASVQIVSG
eukprot:COSAG02_NODE_4965_length_4774_cov_8.825455_3_plen_99_part_00